MVTTDFITAISQLSAEKNLETHTVLAAVEAAMASALKKDELQYAELEVKIDPDSGEIELWRVYEVMDDDDIEDDELQVTPERAANMGFIDADVGDEVREPQEQTPSTGRIAAQTAKQVVLQRLREAEREVVFDEYTGKEGELVSGTVLRVEGPSRQVIIDLGRTEAVLPGAEQVRPEHYRVGQRLRVFIKEVYRASKGPQVVVSRSHPDLVRRLFELEVPEVSRGLVEVMSISRDPGYRAKVAVISRQTGVDPIGACVGVRGMRIQNIVNELGGERVDLIRWDSNDAAFIANALSPAEVVSIRLDEGERTAFVAVPDKQLSLAIGKEGQNASLAARISGWRVDIRGEMAVIQEGGDLYPPPDPNMEAMPVEDIPALTSLSGTSEEVAPSQADYTRPGLPGEGAPSAPPEISEDPILTPELEVIRDLESQDDEKSATTEPETEPTPEQPREETRSSTDAHRDTGGLRFGEDIRGSRDLDEEEEHRQANSRRGRRGRRGPVVDRPDTNRRTSRRVDIEDEDIDEGLGTLDQDDLDFEEIDDLSDTDAGDRDRSEDE